MDADRSVARGLRGPGRDWSFAVVFEVEVALVSAGLSAGLDGEAEEADAAAAVETSESFTESSKGADEGVDAIAGVSALGFCVLDFSVSRDCHLGHLRASTESSGTSAISLHVNI